MLLAVILLPFLDNGNIISYTRNQHNVSVTIVMSSVECRGYEEHLIECSYNHIHEVIMRIWLEFHAWMEVQRPHVAY